MQKQRKPLSTKKPPIPALDHKVITNWLTNETMPSIQPLVKRIDQIIIENIPNLHYAVKWSKAFYGTKERGWLIEISAYSKSMNIVFLNGASFERQPPLGSDAQTRYIKVSTLEEINHPSILDFIEQARKLEGWK